MSPWSAVLGGSGGDPKTTQIEPRILRLLGLDPLAPHTEHVAHTPFCPSGPGRTERRRSGAERRHG